jgi:hypothetical protein
MNNEELVKENQLLREELEKTCWAQNKKGICVVKKTKNNEWSERLNILEQHINYWINPSNKTNKTIEIIQLYYDT